MRSNGLAIVFGVALLAGACASSKPHLVASTQIGSLAWTEMPGLTQDEIRKRLGLVATGETVAATAKLEDGVVVTTMMHEYLKRIPCGTPAQGRHSETWLSHALVTLTFRDGRLAKYEETGGVQHGTGPETPLTATCRTERNASLGETLSNGQTAGFIVPALLMSPIMLAQKAATDAAQSERTAAFAQLRLGEAPPGGLAAWAEAHRKIATVSGSPDGRAEIRFASQSQGLPFSRYAYLVDGKVVELKGSAPGVCVMQADRSMMCDVPYTLR